jgi:hypothetical protein
VSTNRARQTGGQARQPRPGRPRSPRPLPKGDTLFTPEPSPTRASIEQRSATTLLWLHQLPAWLPPVLAVALLLTGLAVGGWAGAIALFVLAAALGWLAVVSWPRLSAKGRVLRLAVVAAIAVIAVLRAMH